MNTQKFVETSLVIGVVACDLSRFRMRRIRSPSLLREIRNGVWRKNTSNVHDNQPERQYLVDEIMRAHHSIK